MRRAGASPSAIALVLGLLAFMPAPVLGEPEFHGVGDLPGGATTSTALAVSADGAVAVGGSESSAGAEAFRWTGPGTIQGLGALDPGDFYSVATGVSANGSVIVGATADGNGRAFRWTSGGGMVGLGRFSCLGCDNHALANGVSGNGLVAVGSGADTTLLGIPFIEAARWAGGGTSISGLGHLSGGGDASVAYGASNDGAVIVGESDSSSGTRAFAWRTSGGMLQLPSFAGALIRSQALAISSNASTIVGAVNTSATTAAQLEAARWTGASWATLSLLGDLPGATADFSSARAATGDGAIIVGVATNAEGENAAFVWDAAHGMRDLRALLLEDYGLPVEDWTLIEARGVSNVAGGAYTIVGAGMNPAGIPEGWVAYLEPVACSDGLDDDGDLAVDFPADSGCLRRSDPSETFDCADGLDNDDDGQIDAADLDCTGAADASELPDCGDGFDNDGDGDADFPADAGCRSAAGRIENPACDDGVDNDGDGAVDFPSDLRCVAADDASEIADCSDGLDNDGDGAVDLLDPDCVNGADLGEDPQCSDRVDNDGDLRRDYPDEFPECASAADTLETPQCSDALDNDGDGSADLADAQCPNAAFSTESPGVLALGDLVVADAAAGHVFAIDPDTGLQTLLGAGVRLTSPQGLAFRASGELVVADPAGLVELDPIHGSQRLASGPLDAFDSLQVVFAAGGDAIVIERDRLSSVDWMFAGIGPKTTLVSIPSPDGNLGAFVGFSLAREASGHLLVTGLGASGNGIQRVNPATGAVSTVTPGFNPYAFSDLAVEASGTILAVGTVTGTGTGLFRVNPASGALSVVNADATWKKPTAVAVDAAGNVFAADAGTCDAGSCSGGSVVKLHPASGARLATWTGPLMQGAMDLAVVLALPACRNGLDDDAAGGADFPADVHCSGPSHVSELPACGDGLDNDGDGSVDLADAGCASATGRKEAPQCSDGVDNDGDQKLDWNGAGIGTADPQCAGVPSRDKETANSCGIGFELALLLPTLAALRARAGRPPRG
jgi:probable HAF family extracellular repeat protein